MLRIGVTGGIGSGKTTVCDVFKQLNVPVYEADIRAKELVNQDPEIKKNIINAFGEASFINNIYNRSFIASIVFSNADKLQLLNSIIHPVLLEDWKSFCETHKHLPYIVKEAAIMLETDSKNSIDWVILVYAEQDIRINRVMKRDGSKYQDVLARINAQMPDEEKLKLANEVIFNDDEHSIIEQVYSIHHRLMKSI